MSERKLKRVVLEYDHGEVMVLDEGAQEWVEYVNGVLGFFQLRGGGGGPPGNWKRTGFGLVIVLDLNKVEP